MIRPLRRCRIDFVRGLDFVGRERGLVLDRLWRLANSLAADGRVSKPRR